MIFKQMNAEDPCKPYKVEGSLLTWADFNVELGNRKVYVRNFTMSVSAGDVALIKLDLFDENNNQLPTEEYFFSMDEPNLVNFKLYLYSVYANENKEK